MSAATKAPGVPPKTEVAPAPVAKVVARITQPDGPPSHGERAASVFRQKAQECREQAEVDLRAADKARIADQPERRKDFLDQVEMQRTLAKGYEAAEAAVLSVGSKK